MTLWVTLDDIVRNIPLVVTSKRRKGCHSECNEESAFTGLRRRPKSRSFVPQDDIVRYSGLYCASLWITGFLNDI